MAKGIRMGRENKRNYRLNKTIQNQDKKCPLCNSKLTESQTARQKLIRCNGCGQKQLEVIK